MSAKRVVVDTNVVVSALTAGGTPQKIIEAWILGKILVVLSNELRDDFNEVLRRSKFAPFDNNRRILLGILFNKALMVLPRRIHKIQFSDEDDHFLLELATTGQAKVIVTGDQALLKIKSISGIQILDPYQFCKKFKLR